MLREEKNRKPVPRFGKRLRGNQINWNQVFYFSEVARVGSIKGAAAHLEVSSPTLSEHIAQLERDLEVGLFLRQHRKLILTPEGTRLFQYAKLMFETGQRLIDVVSPVPLGCYPVSVGLVPSFSLQSVYQFMAHYLSKHRHVNMKCHHAKHDELEKGLSETRFDFGFSDRVPERKDIVHRLVRSSSLGFYVKSSIAHRKLAELIEDMPLLICKVELGAQSPIERLLEEGEVHPKSVVASDYPSLILDLCRAGRGIAVLSEESASSFKEVSQLRMPKGAPKLKDRLFALWPRGAENSESVSQFRALLPPERKQPKGFKKTTENPKLR